MTLSGFPHSDICGLSAYLRLTAAFRSLSRPSSAPDAKAFPMCSLQLNLLLPVNLSLFDHYVVVLLVSFFGYFVVTFLCAFRSCLLQVTLLTFRT